MVDMTSIAFRDEQTSPVVSKGEQIDRLALSGSAFPYEIKIYSSREEILALGECWQSLAHASESADFFQSWEWCREYLAHCKDDPDFVPLVAVAKHGNEIVALLPLSVQSRYGLKLVTGLTEPFQQYTELLIKPGFDGAKLSGAMISEIKQRGFDLIHLGQVRDGSNLQLALHGSVSGSGEVDAAPSVPLSQWKDFDEYFLTVKSKTRKNMRNARNKLEKQGRISHHVYKDGPEFAKLVHRTFVMRKQWLKETGITSRAFREQQFEEFIDHIAQLGRSGSSDLQLIGMSMRLDDHPIAEQWGFIHKKRYYAFISGWDMAYDFASPGKLHLGEVIKACYEEGLDSVDMMIPNVAYKQTWARETPEVKDYVLPMSFKGGLYGKLWLDLFRPVAKKAFYKLPLAWRERVLALLG